jgi:galactokinase
MTIELWVPGRIEFLGKHTDYAGGRSLLCPVDRGFRVTAEPRDDDVVRVTDRRSRESVECTITPDISRPRGHWANYVFTVVRRIARDFPDARIGADIAFESDLPVAAGMSSSSALVVAVYMALAEVNQLSEHSSYRANIGTPEHLAEYIGCIEGGFAFRAFAGDEGVGTLSGCEDQTAMVCGRAGALVQYSFCPVRYETSYPVPPNHDFVIAASGVVAEKTASALEKYNALSRRASAASEAWRRASGRADQTLGDAVVHASADDIRAAIAQSPVDGFTPADLVDRFNQFYVESELIIPEVGRALSRGDLSAVGELVDQSQVGAEGFLDNQIPETIQLARSARELGAVAASAFGAGFGGSVWALTRSADTPDFLRRWQEGYARAFPAHRETARFFVTHAGRPASRVD